MALWTISEDDYFSPDPEYALKIEQHIQRYRNRARQKMSRDTH